MMVGPDQHRVIHDLLYDVSDTEGDVVEVGCNAGSTSRLLAKWIRGTGCQLHLYDSFEGLPEESGYAGLMASPQSVLESAVCEELDTNETPTWVHIHPGWFRDTMPNKLPKQIRLAFVDCDVYESMVDSIKPILPRLTGVMIIHDFAHHKLGGGIRRAVADFGLIVSEQNQMGIAWKADQC